MTIIRGKIGRKLKKNCSKFNLNEPIKREKLTEILGKKKKERLLKKCHLFNKNPPK